MLELEEIKKGARLTGLDPRGIVRVPSVEPAGTDAVTVYLKGPTASSSSRCCSAPARRAHERPAVLTISS